jgi:hypothetical protein
VVIEAKDGSIALYGRSSFYPTRFEPLALAWVGQNRLLVQGEPVEKGAIHGWWLLGPDGTQEPRKSVSPRQNGPAGQMGQATGGQQRQEPVAIDGKSAGYPPSPTA